LCILIHKIYKYTDYIGHAVGNSILTLGVSNGKIIGYSNEFLYLIKVYYDRNKNSVTPIIQHYITINSLIKTKKETEINNDVVIFITSFSSGTVHGYAGLYYMLIEYKKKYDGKKVLVFKNSQKGLLDIIHHIIPKTNIIEIDDNKLYKIKNGIFIDNKWHIFDHAQVINFLKDFIIINDNIKYDKYDKYDAKTLCIIKNSKSQNVTNVGIISHDNVLKYCVNNGYVLIEPSEFNEIDLINIIYRCRNIILSWGTTLFKNRAYISSECNNIKCFVTEDFMNQYNSFHNYDQRIKYYKVSFDLENIIEL